MKDKILEILKRKAGPEWGISKVRDYYTVTGEDIENVASEIESLIKENYYPKEFLEWYVTEGQFEYRFGVGQVPSPLAEALDYWQINNTC